MSIIKGSETHTTNDYSIFKFSLKNRPVQEFRVKHWKHEFSNGRFFLKTFPITITRDFFITDGQHRYAACKALGLPIYYKFSDELTLNNVADVQMNSKWTTSEVVHSKIQQGNKEYAVLKEFADAHDVTIPIAVLLIGEDRRDSKKINLFATGNFKAKNIVRGNEIAKLMPALKACGFKPYMERNFVQALIDIYGQYDTERMIEKIEQWGASILRKQTKIEYYVNNLEQIYSYHSAGKNKVYFKRKSINQN